MCDLAIKFHQIILDVSRSVETKTRKNKTKDKRRRNNRFKWRQIKDAVLSSQSSDVHFAAQTIGQTQWIINDQCTKNGLSAHCRFYPSENKNIKRLRVNWPCVGAFKPRDIILDTKCVEAKRDSKRRAKKRQTNVDVFSTPAEIEIHSPSAFIQAPLNGHIYSNRQIECAPRETPIQSIRITETDWREGAGKKKMRRKRISKKKMVFG